ncbi:gamma-crystallin M2-like [Genypterus blacodes]|uniref:gamma-crystallin M2-like n=1 Tax=Genypterus blacodes TaxID=154954 RepID=UPI003F7766ED
MGKIIFFEEKNFAGQHFDFRNDCADLMGNFSHCHSIRVESGCFMIYENPNYTGHLGRGDYPDYHQWMGVSDSVCSCRIIPSEPGSFKMCLYERLFGGHMMDLLDDCSSIMDCFHIYNVFSCNVRYSNWLLYDQPKYRGRMYLVRPGEYKRFNEWGSRNVRVGSIRRIIDH